MRLSDYFLQQKYNRWRRKHPVRESVMVSYAAAKDVGVLFWEDENQQSDLNRFVEKLVKDGKRVRALTYFEHLHSHPYQFKFDYFTKKEISVWGEIRNEKVSQFMDFPFDYLFCLSRHDFPPFDHILLQCHAKFRIGFHQPEKEDTLDFMFEVREEGAEQNPLQQLYEYTNKLSSSIYAH